MTVVLEKLGGLCASWGGALKELTVEEFKTTALIHAPFSLRKLGVNWEAKEVSYSGKVISAEVT